ncbi:trypsin-like peptidase domain-containing protein [Kitasatospora phosalacinea]|uniref:Trypsin-like peptidase domain-containing protein n=1 Tax=Kitasatospora phosalacinea TaxID=2065 RepID=A0ABW6GDJ8_9ACTN
MRWFDPATGDPDGPESPEDEFRSGLVSLLGVRDGKKTVVGGGVFLGGRYVLTCAHVVNSACGRELMDRTDARGTTVAVRFVGADRALGRGRGEVVEWNPPARRDGRAVLPTNTAWEGDLAVLALDAEPPPTVRAPRWRDLAVGQRLRAWLGDGLAISAVDATVKMVVREGTYLESDDTPRKIGPRYSGGPLWSREDRAAVGLVSGVLPDKGEGLTLVIPWQRILAEVPLLRNLPLPGADRWTAADFEPEDLTPVECLLDAVLSGREVRALAARAVCDKLGLATGRDGTAPGVGEFAALLLGRPRAAAALLEHFLEQGDERTAEQLLKVCHEVAAPGVLTPLMHRLLIGILDDLHAKAPGAVPPDHVLLAAARIPPLGPLGHGRARYLRLVDELEARRAAPRLAGPLLRYVEHLASALVRRPEAEAYGKRLRDWSEMAATKQAVPPAGLSAHRAMAEEWAATAPTGAPRVVLRLNRYENDTAAAPGRVQYGLWADHGDGRPVPAGPNDDRPVPPHQVAAAVLALVGDLALEQDTDPRVEVFLDERDLRLPVEEWTDRPPAAAPAPGGPHPLGSHAPVVVRLTGGPSAYPPQWRRRELKRRWRSTADTAPLDLGEAFTHADQVVGEALENPDAAWAVIHGGTAERRTELAAACLGFGVPFVLWDRSGTGAPPGELFDRLRSLGHPCPAEALEALRTYRVQAHRSREHHPLRPVLAREDPDRLGPPSLTLTPFDDRPLPDTQEDAP